MEKYLDYLKELEDKYETRVVGTIYSDGSGEVCKYHTGKLLMSFDDVEAFIKQLDD